MKTGNKKYTILKSIDDLNIDIPDTCPFCHHGIEPDFIVGYKFEKEMYNHYRIVFSCPRNDCLELFFSIYIKNSIEIYDKGPPIYRGSAPFKYKEEEFNDVVYEISNNFVKIYNQAKQAEDRGLDQICGLGYRKALEFLIKEYLISKFPDEEENIKNNHRFDSVIEKYVNDEKVKFLARRASWLGNDHAHYTRRWEDKDISDLKRLINTAIYWISAEKELEYYQEEMNEAKK